MGGGEMSDTPISDNTPHNVADLGMLCRRLERQLNTANKRLEEIEKSGVYDGRPIDKTYLTIHSDVLSTMVSEKAYDPQTTIRELQDRIKRLEEAGDAMVAAWDREWLTDADIEAIIDNCNEAKEAKM
jgi:hypothetical protein